MTRANEGRVLVIAPAGGRGGIASVVRLHSKTETWRRRQCKLLSTYDDRSLWRKIFTAFRAYTIFPFVIGRAAIVHVHVAAQRSIFRKLPFIMVSKLLRKRVIVHVHAFSPESLYAHTALSAGRYCLSLGDRVVALSDSWVRALRAYDPLLNLCVVPNPVAAGPRHVQGTGAPVVLYAGKLEERKGYRDLLAAAALVLQQFPETQFWFAGHGELSQAAELANCLDIHNSVRLMGWLNEDAMNDAYEAASVFCLPSYNEGVPMVVLEAMSRSLPVVCTRVGGLPDYIQHRENGLFVKAGDPESIAESIVKVLGDNSYAQQMGQNAARTIHARCSLAAVSDQLEEMYRAVLLDSLPASGVVEENAWM
jgi:glycosyltransferase involved in cell wall biosynthesis